MPTQTGPIEGYLVIADIAGYTAFVTATELEHSQSIIAELTTLIRKRLAPPLKFVKLEGDAVFCYASGDTFVDAERLLELFEVCYFDFSSHLFDMERSTTCGCAACANLGMLDLKFVAHYGSFVVQHLERIDDVGGPDVILLHRLLKNTITERTGWRAYAYFTDPCRLPSSIKLLPHREEHASFGETVGCVCDLKPAAEQMREARREYVGPADAVVEAGCDLPVPPVVAWQHIADPLKRVLWEVKGGGDPDHVFANERGRFGVGMVTHCSHGPGPDYVQHCVDWRPFRYFTVTLALAHGSPLALPPWVATVELIPRDDGGTRVVSRGRPQSHSAFTRMRFRIGAPFLHMTWNAMYRRLREIVESEGAEALDAPPASGAGDNTR